MKAKNRLNDLRTKKSFLIIFLLSFLSLIIFNTSAVFAETASVSITTPFTILEPSTSSPADKDGPLNNKSNADPDEGILGAKIVLSDTVYDATVELIVNHGLDGVADILIDDDNPRLVGTYSAGTHYVYWSLNKDQLAALKNNLESFWVKLRYSLTPGGSLEPPVYSDWYSVNLDNSASINQNALDFIESYPVAVSAQPGENFEVVAKYRESATFNTLIAQAYYGGEKVRLNHLTIYYYDDFDPGSVQSGLPPSPATQVYSDTPYIGGTSGISIPTTLSNKDYWIVKYDFTVREYGSFSVFPYIQAKTGCEWKLDTGYVEVEALPGAITGFKFNDLNGNGIWDKSSEAGLSGWTIILKKIDGTVIGTTTTNADGAYYFNNVKPGNYKIEEEIQPYWVNKTGNPVSVTVVGGETSIVDFGNKKITPAITITKTADKTTVHQGETVTYTYTVTNTGDDPLINVNIEDDILGHIAGPFDLAPGETKTFTKETVLNQTTTNTTIVIASDSLGGEVTATDTETVKVILPTNIVTATGTDSLGGTVTDTDTKTVIVISPKIEITKTVNRTTIYKGEKVTYTYTVKNTGDDPLINVTLTDDKLGQITEPFNLNPGQEKTFTRENIVLNQTTTNIVTATGTDSLGGTVTDTDTKTVIVEILPSPPPPPPPGGEAKRELSIEKLVDKTIVSPGETLVYTINYKNIGEVEVTSAVITDKLPTGVTYIQGSASNNGVYDPATNTIVWNIEKLPAGAGGKLTYEAKVNSDASGTIRNVVSIRSTETPTPKEASVDSSVVVVVPIIITASQPVVVQEAPVTIPKIKELPYTGMNLPLLFLVGGIFIVIGVVLRRHSGVD
ncbi:MAG: DUF11 domain-containing protein [Actinobacteria bacterium]|nr:DUF11 domain-containing protein [Actinomycetota bacterium]